ETAGKDFLHIPIVPVDTWSLFSIPLLDVPLVQVAKVVELRWQQGWEILPGGVPFNAYWKAVGSKRYGADDVLLMDLAGMQHSRPNFEALKTLMKRKYSVWLEMGVRDVQDIFDAFTLGSQNVILGSMTCSSRKMLEEIVELSDQSIPLLYFDGEVRWGSKRFGPSALKESLDLLLDMGFDRAAVLDLRRLGGKEGFDRHLAEEALSAEIKVLYGGGVRENDLTALRDMGALGGLLDPFTPILKDLIASDGVTEEVRPAPAVVSRESPRGLGLDA
ncbi:MAG: HisA/HisF-related TIM barrel protein, partial [Methanomassiliicoccales archaeon]|nr:HisA/HisF-related TIM barrel protein [Methanomassiliicoccales archaeon]